MTPDISIVIPAYNVERYVAAALNSALAQRHVAAEIVVVDDGSIDATMDRIRSVGDDPRLRVIAQANQGPSGARNTALRAACGRYVGFLDGDDLWEPDKAARHVALMDARPDLDLSYSWWRVIDGDGRVTGRRNRTRAENLPRGMSFEGLLVANFTGTASTVVCRKAALDAVGGFDEQLTSNVDLDVWLRIAARRDGNIGLVEEVLTSYRMHGAQITGNWSRMKANWEKVLEKARAAAPARVAGVETVARALLSRYLAYLAYEQRDYLAARRMMLDAWAKAPRAVAGDARVWLISAAIGTASVLPDAWHDGLSRVARDLRARIAAGDASAGQEAAR